MRPWANILICGLMATVVLCSVGCVKREVRRKDWGAFRIETDAQPIEHKSYEPVATNPLVEAHKRNPIEKFFDGLGNLFRSDKKKKDTAPADAATAGAEVGGTEQPPTTPESTLPPNPTPHPTQ